MPIAPDPLDGFPKTRHQWKALDAGYMMRYSNRSNSRFLIFFGIYKSCARARAFFLESRCWKCIFAMRVWCCTANTVPFFPFPFFLSSFSFSPFSSFLLLFFFFFFFLPFGLGWEWLMWTEDCFHRVLFVNNPSWLWDEYSLLLRMPWLVAVVVGSSSTGSSVVVCYSPPQPTTSSTRFLLLRLYW